MNTQVAFDPGTLLHEIGHALGLKHPTEVVGSHTQVLASNDPNLTIMAEGSGGSGILQQFDRDAVAAIYGAEVTGLPDVVTSDASATYSVAENAFVATWSWVEATQTLTQMGRATNDTIRGTSVHDVISGSDGRDKLFGLAGTDTLNGGAGNDTLDGGGDADRMAGGTGNDTYFVDHAGDVVLEMLNRGYDRVYASVSYTLANNVEELWMLGDGLTGNGNALANSIFGDGTYGDNINGLNGNDYIVSGGGADTVHGGNHNDTVWGGAGADRIYGDANNDWLHGEGDDDTIVGGTGNDTITGGAGKDSLSGNGGSDVFVFEGITDSGTSFATRDTINDFTELALAAGSADKMDFSVIDADGNEAGDQAFSFIGAGPFTAAGVGDTAGQIRFQVIGGNTFIYVDVDRDQVADLTIRLMGDHSGLTAGDFNL